MRAWEGGHVWHLREDGELDLGGHAFEDAVRRGGWLLVQHGWFRVLLEKTTMDINTPKTSGLSTFS